MGSGIAHLDLETEDTGNNLFIDNNLFLDIPLKIGFKWLIKRFILQFQAGTGYRLQHRKNTEISGEPPETITDTFFFNSFIDFPNMLITGIVFEISIGGAF